MPQIINRFPRHSPRMTNTISIMFLGKRKNKTFCPILRFA